jgi:hypothetical protein
VTWTRAWSVVAKTCAVFFALATALIGQGFTGAVEPAAGAMDNISWVVIGVALFAGLFFAPNVVGRGPLARVVVGLAMAPGTYVLGRSVSDVFNPSRVGPPRSVAIIFAIGLVAHVIAYAMLVRARRGTPS